MKTLFAVSNENVSNKIVDSYRKKYGNTLSFKNVFYFNAIINEIRKDKTYDRIVISEDLEPFANSNYEAMDKFILDRLEEVSYDAINQDGKNIDIIVICTDRRAKKSKALSKMYELGIYNALIGPDRRIDNVCNLLQEPRTSEEAKEYYQISDVEDENSLDDVTEQEVQNILIHYKKIGKNEDKYVDSFNNIAAQYTDNQLKIIIKCLPINVRAVLEADCPKYQELVTTDDETDKEKAQKAKIQEKRKLEKIENDKKLKAKIEKEKKESAKKAQKKAEEPKESGIDLIDNKRKETKMTGNVIIPNNMDVKKQRKVYSDEEIDKIINDAKKPRQSVVQPTENKEPVQINEQPQVQQVAEPVQSTVPTNNEPVQVPSMQPQPVQEPVNQVADTLPGLDNMGQMPEIQPQPIQEPVNQVADTLPGLDNMGQMPEMQPQPIQEPVNQVADTLPGLDNMGQMPEMQPQPMQEPVNQVADTLPGIDNMGQMPEMQPQPVQEPVNQVANTLPGFDNMGQMPEMQPQPAQEPVNQVADVLPGLDNSNQSSDVQEPVKADDLQINNDEVTNSVESNNENAENQTEETTVKRGRGRPRKYPIEPPKPKGKRGRPRKNPVVEENNINADTVEQPESNEQVANVEQPQQPDAGTLPGLDDPFANAVQPQQPDAGVLPGLDDPFANAAQPQQPDAGTLPGLDDPFANTVQPQQPDAGTLPGLDDPFANTVQPQQPDAGTLPGLDDPFANAVQPQQPDAGTLPGLDDPFANTVQPQQPDAGTLPGFDDPFANTVQPQQPDAGTLPGFDDPFANTVQPQQPDAGTLPGLDDPFANTVQLQQPDTGTLPGLDDPFANTVQPQQPDAGTLPGLDDPFANTAQPQQPDAGTLPGLDDPFANTVQPQQPDAGTLPGLDDPFASTAQPQQPDAGTLPGLDDPFANTIQPQQPDAGTLPGFDDLEDLNSSNMQQYNADDIINDSNNPISPIEEKIENQIEENPVDNLVEDFVELSENNMQNSYNPVDNNIPGVAIPGIETEPKVANSYSPSMEKRETIQQLEKNKVYQTGSLETALTKDKKIVAFVGTSKNGTSFLINNLACLFSSIGVKTAILDMTQNKNSYYIYTNNDEKLRNIAFTSIEKLEKGTAEGIKVDRNLDVYTAMPNDGKDYSNSEAILSTLVQNASLVLIDCDFNTDYGYFANAQEIYIVQSMDILTIQPLTAFLRDLKTRGLLEQDKLRVVINKELKVKGLSSKAVIGGTAFYNDPSMSFMTELFNKDKIKACTIPFDENVYSKYLEAMLNCVISINGYSKNFMNSLKILGNMVYPLLSKQTYNPQQPPANTFNNSKFSSQTNDTLNQMKNNY